MGYILTFIFGCICGAASLLLFACLAVASDDDDQVIPDENPETSTNQDVCVCCGDVIPEGRMVCPNCEGKDLYL